MNNFKFVGLVCFFIAYCNVSAQDYKFGQVSKEEINETQYAKDSSASAVVLYRNQSLYFKYTQDIGFHVITNIHERIKIYNKDGFKYAMVSETLYKNGSSKESISGVKAFTFNLEGGKVVKQKMDKSGIFSNSLNKYRDEEKFTLPNVKEGSVIEYEYQITSPFYYSIDEIDLQYNIPIKKQEIAIAAPEYFVFKPIMKGYLAIKPKYGTKLGNINFTNKRRSEGFSGPTSYSTNTLSYTINTTDYVMSDVPALKEEPFVNHMDNYRSAVNYELQYVQLPQSSRESYTTTWEQVITKIYESDGFGDQLKPSRYYEEDLEALVAANGTEAELMFAIYSFVQERMSWNNFNGYTVYKGVKEAYQEKSGNIADINLLLTSMLQKAGLDANPVLVSTRDHGVPLFPTMEGFNYIIAAVELNGETILLDASNKFAEPNLVPTRALNWYGRLIKKDGTSVILDLTSQKVNLENINLTVNLTESGNISGKYRKYHFDYKAYLFRNENSSIAKETYLEQLENTYGGMEISSYEVKNKKTLGKPVIESFSFDLENQASVVGDKIYFSPLFFMAMEENPFKLEERKYPIDFTYPWQEKYVISVVLPEGYKVESLPKNLAMALRDDLGSFKYQIVQIDKGLQIVFSININNSLLAASYYSELKEFFKIAIEKQTEKVVLSKIESDGTTESSEKGR
ncbi:transglutaminase [Maribacter sp. CXY002]|uniref:transglutaminase n=1 Tax=Maribacter luteocoastalis TaxID=3407671 RepID=UPI003B68398E